MAKRTGIDRIKIEAATNSLKKSIAEIEAHLAGKNVAGTDSFHRAELHATLAEFAARWYRKGFNRGHRESFQSYAETGKVPKSMRAKVKRDLFGGRRKSVKLKSRIKL